VILGKITEIIIIIRRGLKGMKRKILTWTMIDLINLR